MNSLVPINRLPLDVLSLIPTHLPSQKDRFHATFVCRRWRRILLQHAGLWSQLILSKGEVYVKTLLERAKGSPLSILASCMDPVGTILLLPPYTKQITNIDFENSSWVNIQGFSEIISGPLPLLRTLNINVVQGINPDGPDTATPPSQPLFSGAIDLKTFHLYSEGSAFLSHFVFPNLTSFELSVASEKFHCLQLLDFLEAMPMLQVVDVKIITRLWLEGIPDGRVVVLHNVETFCLVASDGEGSHELAINISCPSVQDTSLTHIGNKYPNYGILLESFPVPDKLAAIIHNYTRSPIEEVTFEAEASLDCFFACSFTFRCADATILRLCFEVTEDDEDKDTSQWERSPPEIHRNFFSDAFETLRELPLLADVKRLHVYGLINLSYACFMDIAYGLGRLFEFLGPLEELTICRCDMRLCFPPFFPPEIHERMKPVTYPLIRVLTISDPYDVSSWEVEAGLVELTKAQHELGVPFERVVVRMWDPPAKMEKNLRPWVAAVDCCDMYEED